LDLVTITKRTDAADYNTGANDLAAAKTRLFPNTMPAANYTDAAASIGLQFNNAATTFQLVVAKGTYANLGAAQTALAGTKYLYKTAAVQVSSADLTGAIKTQYGKTINIKTWPGVHGMFQPDAMVSYTVGSKTYLVTANEGDARAWGEDNDAYWAGEPVGGDCAYNIYISTTEPGRVEVIKRDADELREAFKAFLAVCEYYFWVNKYDPRNNT
jgi:hypothetical protein